ncbi:MAG: hypothetical protein JW724_01095 [Candidatus Altiarchaeota archaeon]|nr:hypothetical protein [Candidatus Altiarchaeota archaeon]
MNPEKTIGYVLLLIGLGIISFSIFSAFAIFGGEKSPPELFKLEKSEKPLTIAGIEIPGLELVPAEYLNLSGNLMFFLLFMWLLISAGGRISSIGVSMIKK